MAAETEELAQLHKETREPNMDREILNKRELYRASVSHRTQKIVPAGTLMEFPRTIPVPGPWPVGAAARSWEVTGEDNGFRVTSPTAPAIDTRFALRKYGSGCRAPGSP